MKASIPLLGLLVVFGCGVFGLLLVLGRGEAEKRVAVAITYARVPVVVDPGAHELPMRHVTSLSTATYVPLYVGPPVDSVVADHRSAYRNGIDQGWLDRSTDLSYYVEPKGGGLSIQVDTSQVIGNNGQPWYDDHHRAYPVAIAHDASDTLPIGYGMFIDLVMEARTPAGAWAPIEHPYIYECGNGLATVLLPPGAVALTSVPVDSGAYHTSCRLRLGDGFSNTFGCNIDTGQFTGRVW